MSKALEHIRVLDLSRVLAGPFCTQILGDLGADIIKIERPGAGDDTRQWGPPFLKDKNGNDTSESAYYLSANRNKKSLAIDIKTKEGQALLNELIKGSDILIQNFKVGGLDKYGLGYEQLKDKHPHLIYCAISGFGQEGPLASEPGYDFLAQAMAGLMSATGEPDAPPMKVGVALSDIITGLNAAIGILAALHHREQTGKGQMVDVALTDCTLASLSNLAQYYLTSGKVAPRLGNAHSTIVPYQSFETADGHIIIAVGNNDQFVRLCQTIGQSDWAADERFATNRARVEHRETLVPMIADIIKTKTTDKWLSLFRESDVPSGPVNTMDKVFDMEQIQTRGMQIQMDHPLSSGKIDLVGSPIKLSETPASYDNPPPICGEHTQEILEKLLGLSEEEIEDLKKKNIIEAKQ
ncbi:MAG: CoA transferase [Alphaproteobacteria bacterium]|nr:CoA transferase [Alphaproteobacteria bacterium]